MSRDWHSEFLTLADCADVPYKALGAADTMQQRRDDGDLAEKDRPVGAEPAVGYDKFLGGTRGSDDC